MTSFYGVNTAFSGANTLRADPVTTEAASFVTVLGQQYQAGISSKPRFASALVTVLPVRDWFSRAVAVCGAFAVRHQAAAQNR